MSKSQKVDIKKLLVKSLNRDSPHDHQLQKSPSSSTKPWPCIWNWGKFWNQSKNVFCDLYFAHYLLFWQDVDGYTSLHCVTSVHFCCSLIRRQWFISCAGTWLQIRKEKPRLVVIGGDTARSAAPEPSVVKVNVTLIIIKCAEKYIARILSKATACGIYLCISARTTDD